MKIGAHVSTVGGIGNAVARGQEIGCDATQIFGSSPQTWAFRPVPADQRELFKQKIDILKKIRQQVGLSA